MTASNEFTTLSTKPEIITYKAEFTVTNRGESSVTFKGDMMPELYGALVDAIRAVMEQ